MKKITSTILLLIALCSLISSCKRQYDAYLLLREFALSYDAEGIIYSPEISEGNDGYVSEGLLERIYLFSGDFPDNYAILLNSRTDFSSECGLFICSDAEMLGMVEEMCLERIMLICNGDDRAFVKRSGNIVFYSTLKDRERAERVFSEIIR